jgi:hypothetical protein
MGGQYSNYSQELIWESMEWILMAPNIVYWSALDASPGLIKCWKFLRYLSHCQLLKKSPAIL